MSDELNDFFKNLFNGAGGDGLPSPEPTPEQLSSEALAATRIHLEAFNVSQDQPKSKTYFDMLPAWKTELAYYLPILEQDEEYERCQEVFTTLKKIDLELANIKINEALNELDIEMVDGELSDTDDSNDNIDF